MTRIVAALATLAVSPALWAVGDATPAGPAMIGADRPVYLGRMVVSARALPEEAGQLRP